ncbi:MAG: CHAT domain-containing protein [Saprospiraceae bacterium]|nr:CHAT domain-containing protein [Saprospiraceae bacterium]
MLDNYQNQSALERILLVGKELESCNAAVDLQRKVYLHTDQCYRSLVTELLQKGLFNRSIDLIERDIALHLRTPDPHTDHLATAYLLLGNAHNLNNNQQLSIEAHLKGLQVRQAANPTDPKISSYYDQISNSYLSLEDTANAYYYLMEWERFIKKTGKKGSALVPVRLATQWAMYHEIAGRPELGARILEDTLLVYAEDLKSRSTFIGIAEFQLCELYAQTGNFKKSLYYSEKNIASLEERMMRQNGKLFTRSHYAWYLAQSARAAWNLYIQTGDLAMKQLAIQRATSSENVLREMRDRAPDDGFREWIANRVGIVSNLMEVRYGLYAETGDLSHIERSFESYEASKMFVVQEFLQETQALQWGGVPDSLYARENAYRQAINDMETNFFMLRNKPDADSLLAVNDRQLFSLRDEYRVFLKDLENRYPEYFRLKYRHTAISLKEVQTQMLLPGECLLDLCAENSQIYLMLIRPDTVIWYAAPFDPKTENALQILATDSRQYAEYQHLPEQAYLQKMQAYADAAHQAYLALIAPVRRLLTEQVILVPRNHLANLPFGALLTQAENNPAKPFLWHYLDQELTLSQTYSAGLFHFLQTRSARIEPDGSVLALAPFYEEAPSKDLHLPVGDVTSLTRDHFFQPLPGSGMEVKTIAEQSKGRVLMGKSANKTAFLAQCADYKILHLATHSVVNEVLGEYSFVALQADEPQQKVDVLYARDIYGLRLSANLVVLSACETALGQYREDEGMVGLTRAFQCAGTRNVAASLWTVNDAGTSALMVNFHQEIQKGFPYNRALSNAKRKFLRENRQYAHPYYWAGFVLHGR